jgi:hypothetical protein
MKPRIYVETSVISFYHDVRTEPEMIARRKWTQRFWQMAESDYTLLSSLAVIDELEQGIFPNQQQMIELVNDLPIVPIDENILEIVDTYIDHKVMPGDPRGDALHLALASYHKCDFLLTLGTAGIWPTQTNSGIFAVSMLCLGYTFRCL